jgi:hypothetical protein
VFDIGQAGVDALAKQIWRDQALGLAAWGRWQE